MATNDILQFAGSASGGDILAQVAYAADADRTDGNQVGIARRALNNKALKQSSTISAAVAQFMADAQSNNIDDTVAVATLAGYLKTAIKNATILFTSAAGAADALTAAFTPATTALADGKFMIIRAGAANATSAPTLAVDGLTAKTIVKGSDDALSVGDIAGAGFYLLVSYDATLDKYVLNNPATTSSGSSLGFLNLKEIRSSGTDAGTFTSGAWRDRTLNTEVTGTIAGVTMGLDIPTGRLTPTMPAGTYKVTWSAPAHNVNRHQSRLYDTVGAVTVLVGTTENTTGSGSTSEEPTTTRSTFSGIMTLAGATTLRLQHRCSTTQATTGLGSAASFGEDEVYSEILFEKLS